MTKKKIFTTERELIKFFKIYLSKIEWPTELQRGNEQYVAGWNNCLYAHKEAIDKLYKEDTTHAPIS